MGSGGATSLVWTKILQVFSLLSGLQSLISGGTGGVILASCGGTDGES